ncbi:hypothetical protein AR457_32360 [Streptomyces agglomeratus]|uniref:Uncharacterized protein n=1 Tax=Streptomyces agglomeratus TaxID=285458 RepID=A0A1E5PG08_9ACTN|nr:hypothetical protein [Streptomyces agglomeratus]OEJ28467.1 hypothetical protein AS594_32270 [Streptomyces agglomeratus]OEJ37472.1 hypothetical protein BGK70_04290 [Streptomyces agglomeratus]OEJ48144.1 hypothetical protein AR457_32360 [Streptomyces agglomeratus]OEJ50013.1 hypothetical protein BGK72_03805 [Streptomyces agglomeratus]OEJ57342.1 hypothetical protein BGM19_04485 [Streptomyces agglomeratus]
MYEMRAEPTIGKGELIWHVIHKDVTASTLCGRSLMPDSPAALLAQIEAAAERYCSSCMTAFSSAFSSAVQHHVRR